jgi:prepilin peptidase CpaA
MTESVIGVLLIAVLFVAVYLDIRTSRIPNWLTVTATGSGLLTHILLQGVQGAIFSLTGLGAGLTLFLILYFLGDMGAGDVKLMGAVGAMVGPDGAIICSILAIVVGGIYALATMCYQWGVGNTARKLGSAWYGALSLSDSRPVDSPALPCHLRYGLAIASGTLLFRLGLHPFGG